MCAAYARRNTNRYPGYDYTQPGAYFITLCAFNHEPLFGTVRDGKVYNSACGQIVNSEWLRSTEVRNELVIDCFIVMPNHFHALLLLVGPPTEVPELAIWPLRPKRALGSLVAGFKAAVTKRTHEQGLLVGQDIWQRNYYDHIVRDHANFERIQEYILTNPARWESDRFYRQM
ncbi:MAG TPA: transposase [Anaerolineaceae bacterium]|nr:transposase [Anaerolineaceae bacterium]